MERAVSVVPGQASLGRRPPAPSSSCASLLLRCLASTTSGPSTVFAFFDSTKRRLAVSAFTGLLLSDAALCFQADELRFRRRQVSNLDLATAQTHLASNMCALSNVRKESGRTGLVYGAVSNAQEFLFCKIDTDPRVRDHQRQLRRTTRT